MATILTDDFESYNTGSLADQSSWDDQNGAGIVVVDSPVREGSRALACSSSSSWRAVYRTGTSTADGKTTFYLMCSAATPAGDSVIIFKSAGSAKHIIGFYSAKLQYRGASAYISLVDSPVQNNWYCIECQYDYTTQGGKMRYQVDAGGWTDWTTGLGTFTSLNQIYLEIDYNTDGHFDHIGEEPLATVSASVSPSVSPSSSPSPSVSPSSSPSTSPSPSLSPSSSPSTSPSPSLSPSSSPSLSPSASPSVSPSISPSVSPSVSPSLSPSASPSVSPSASPSTEWTYEDKSDDPVWTSKDRADDPTWSEKDKSSSPTWTFKDKNA